MLDDFNTLFILDLFAYSNLLFFYLLKRKKYVLAFYLIYENLTILPTFF